MYEITEDDTCLNVVECPRCKQEVPPEYMTDDGICEDCFLKRKENNMNTKKIDRDEMFSLLCQYYHQWVRSQVVVFLEECIEEGAEWDNDPYGRDSAQERMAQIVDSMCTYTKDNMITLAASDNDSAYVENFGAEGVADDNRVKYERLAFAALCEDTRDYLNRSGFDWDNITESAKVALKWFED